MKKLLTSFLVIGAILFFGFSSAQAYQITFNDNSHYWGHQESSWTDAQKWTNDTNDGADVVGTPDITNVNAGYIEIVDNQITEVGFHYTGYDGSNQAGDLFIDLDADYSWDYVFDASSNSLYDIYSLSAKKGDAGNAAYLLSTDVFGVDYGGSTYRKEHPVEVDFDEVGNYGFVDGLSHTDFVDNTYDDVVFSLGVGIDLDTSTQLIIGFAPTCANDVVYEKISTVVEPATMLLFGTGLLGLAVISRKKFFK